MAKFKKTGLVFVSGAFHLVAGGLIYYFWRPIVLWYWNYRPVLGVDFYNAATYVGYLARNFALRFNGWKYIWHAGYPMQLDYPSLHAYLNLPLLLIFSLPQAVQAYVLACAFLFLFFSYLLFAEIGKDRILAAVLTIASSFSIALYGALVWGGSLPYAATEFFLPLVLWLLVKFFNTSDRRWYFLSALFLGVSFFGHPQVGFSYAIPASFLLLLFFPLEGKKFFSGARFKRLFLYFLIAVLVGYPQLGLYLGRTPSALLLKFPNTITKIFKSALGANKVIPGSGAPSSGATAGTGADIAQFQRDQLGRFLTETNPLFFPFLTASGLVFLLSFIIRRKRKKSLKALVFSLPVLWIVFYNSLFAYGIGLFHGGWYRVFWPFPLAMGMLISFVWGDFWASIKERLEVLERKFILKTALTVVSGLIVFYPGFLLLRQNSPQKMIHDIENALFRQQSSAFPDSLNVYIDKEELGELKKKLTPSWLDPDDTQYRLFDADQRVNIWWNALFDMPLVKGYVDDPSGDSSGAFYWASIALTQTQGIDNLVETWEVPREMAYNNALFLIDWFSIRYIEAEHAKSDSYNPLTSYLAESDIFANKEELSIPGWAQLYGTPEGQSIIWRPEDEETLSYYGLKDDLVSPIAHSTNASTVGVIGAWDAYNTFIRDLAAVNLNSRRVIPIQLGKFIDGVSYRTLKDMDAVVLYAYDYRNHGKAWGKLEKYVKEGGRVLIETGSEVKQTDSVNLPAKYPQELPLIFPLEMTRQEKLGSQWQLSGNSPETEGVNFEKFGPPVLDGEPWLFSQPNSTEGLREGARVILSGNDIPLVVSWQYGEGEVIWSGMNLPYHAITHKSLEEARFFENLLEDLVSTERVEYSGYEAERKSASKVTVKGSQAKGVFFREQNFPGWRAGIKSAQVKKRLNIYRTVPSFPGLMYVVIPEEARGAEFEVSFTFRGDFWGYFWQAVSLMTVLLLLDRIILNSRLLAPFLKRALAPLRKRAGKWWEREEDY